jgi:heme-degrading monooxygenase HmoA
MMVVIVDIELRRDMESEFETALQRMQERVKKYDGFPGEEPCCIKT